MGAFGETNAEMGSVVDTNGSQDYHMVVIQEHGRLLGTTNGL